MQQRMKIKEPEKKMYIKEKLGLASKFFDLRQIGPSACFGREVDTKLVLHIERLQATNFVLSKKTLKKFAFLK
jgi:hypothetical protein